MTISRTCMYPGCCAFVSGGYCEKHKQRERFCSYPGCGEKVVGSNWCKAHQPKARTDYRRGSAARRGYDGVWQKVSRQYLAIHPLCEECERMGRVVPAVLVHHIKPLCDGGERLSYSNLRALCEICHDEAHKQLNTRFGNG